MKHSLYLAFFLISIFSCSANAESDGSQFTSFAGLELGKAKLPDVVLKFGKTEAIATGDAGESEVALCYKTKYGFIHFLSGEMGGGVDLIGFGASKNPVYKICSKPQSSESLLKLPLAGLNIGMTKASFNKIIKKSVEWKGNVGYVFFENKRPMTKDEVSKFPADMQEAINTQKAQNYFDVSISIIASFKDNALTSFKIWKVETL